MKKRAYYYVYILECSDKTYYTGKTINISKRLSAHNGLVNGGAKYTRTRRPVFLVYFEELKNASEALKREYKLKQLTRDEKIKLIGSNNQVALG